MDIAKLITLLVGGIIALYIVFILVSSLSEITPEFSGIGELWIVVVFIVLILGVITLFKNLL